MIFFGLGLGLGLVEVGWGEGHIKVGGLVVG